MFESILDPILSPLLKLPPLLSILIISTSISVFITLIYKFTTNQELMKSLREKLKEHQKEIKEHRNNPQKAMETQKKAMQLNMEYMKHSFKSTLFTIIPIIIIFGWLNTHMAYYPLYPDIEFTTSAIFKSGVSGTVSLSAPNQLTLISDYKQEIENKIATWTLKGSEGEYIIDYMYQYTDSNDNTYNRTFSKEIIITNERIYKPVEKRINDNKLQMIKVNNEKIIYLNLFGWKLGWLGTYIIFSIIISTLLRKALKIH